ncbi:hypothetical protein KDAU_19220 [Dictyobacter aurantiacus]|uniref:Uncharacterized protein n=1 Tax=Dictyobacter aurantiacus TaxID=1936993 RepID=A0A401ZCP2_9CHLR|nr:hypothetical protein KDAU_19220 [Dictyobacter aurantiacus]
MTCGNAVTTTVWSRAVRKTALQTANRANGATYRLLVTDCFLAFLLSMRAAVITYDDAVL